MIGKQLNRPVARQFSLRSNEFLIFPVIKIVFDEETKIRSLINIIFVFIEDCVIFYCSFRFVSERMLPLQRNER
jgi:PII-like signaling protein